MKQLNAFALILTSALLLTACGNTVDSDATKLAEFQCKAQKLAKRISSGDMSAVSESTKLAAEFAQVKTEIEGKYTTSEEKAKLAEAYLKAMQDCK